MESEQLEPLVAHLVRGGLSHTDAARILADVLAFFSETAEAYVRRRHRELRQSGFTNAQIFAVIARELAGRRVAAPELSERQIRRLVYG